MGKSQIRFYNQTDVGKERKNNQDYFCHYTTIHGELFIVADGMGGYEGGEVASVMAADIISDCVKRYKGSDYKKMLEKAIETASRKIYEKSLQNEKLMEMGTTVVIALIRDNKLLVAHVGDSRCYIWHEGKIIWVTKDHTKVQMMLDKKRITPEEVKKHPDRHILLQAVGPSKTIEVEFNEHTLASRDKILLCTDGLSEYITVDELGKLLGDNFDDVCERLVKIANDRGGRDNITLQMIEYSGVENPPIIPRFNRGTGDIFKKRAPKPVVGGGISLIVILLCFIVWKTGIEPKISSKEIPIAEPTEPEVKSQIILPEKKKGENIIPEQKVESKITEETKKEPLKSGEQARLIQEGTIPEKKTEIVPVESSKSTVTNEVNNNKNVEITIGKVKLSKEDTSCVLIPITVQNNRGMEITIDVEIYLQPGNDKQTLSEIVIDKEGYKDTLMPYRLSTGAKVTAVRVVVKESNKLNEVYYDETKSIE